MNRELDGLSQHPQDEGDYWKGDRSVEESTGEEEAESVSEMVYGFCDQGTDLTVADFCGDTPFVFRGCHEGVDDHGDHEVEGHPAATIGGEWGVFDSSRGKDRIPEGHGGEQGDDGDETAEEDVPAVDEGVLQAETERCGEGGWRHGVCQKIWIWAFFLRRSM